MAVLLASIMRAYVNEVIALPINACICVPMRICVCHYDSKLLISYRDFMQYLLTSVFFFKQALTCRHLLEKLNARLEWWFIYSTNYMLLSPVSTAVQW